MREDFCDVWRSWELRCSCDQGANRQLCAKDDRLNFRRKYLRLKALAICRKHVGFGSKGWLKLVGSTIFFEKVLEQVDMQCIPNDLSVAFRL